MNDTIRSGGLEGKIITIECLSYDATNDWKIDTEVSLSSLSNKNVFIVRVFYEMGLPSNEEIGIVDFAPQLISRGTFFKRPKYETFDKVIERAFGWLSENPDINFRNAQSIDIKMKSLSQHKTHLMAFTEHGDYIRIFRVTYTKPVEAAQGAIGRTVLSSPIYLSTKIFLPYKKSDTISDIKQRLSDWVNQYLAQNYEHFTGQRWPRVLSAETVEVFAKDFRDDNVVELEKAALDDTFLANRFGSKNAYMFFSLRIFYQTFDRTKCPKSSDNSIDTIDNNNDHN
ncbi:uncharacterized protein LOC128964703 [Oppia nitens]|uniref:uncharacterized protein LOC128964703 n=1 Tax=Oppia nitens TaxID=1686743 RepID=UPI0023DBF44A|nr:uncharacterized protein LOC128964703 [Oppia nitens]